MKKIFILFTRMAIILVLPMIAGACVERNSEKNHSDSPANNPKQMLANTDNIDSIFNVIEDSLRIQVPRQIKEIEPEMPAYNVYDATVSGDFPDFTITYFFRFDESLSQSFLDHLKDKSSGWEREKNKEGETIYKKEDYVFKSKAAEMEGAIDSKYVLVINTSKNNGYFRSIDY